MRNACAPFTPTPLECRQIGFFPERGAPRVIWAGVRCENDSLLRLQSAIEAVARPFSSEKPETDFTGHVTLGRVKELRSGEADKLREAAAALVECSFGSWLADAVVLVRSELSSEGARHVPLAKMVLTSRPV